MTGDCDFDLSIPLTVLSTGTNVCQGPGASRNVGAAASSGDILLFTDSDVIVPSDLLAQISQAFQDHPNADAIIGSYDAEPGAPNFLSQYKNLLHHFVHQSAPAEVATFWTGCGAIRAPIFRALGGFDETRGQLDDVELGFRLRRHGHSVRLCKSIQVKHLKAYRAASLLRSDILDRALPWSRIILDAGSWPGEVNLQKGQASSALLLATLLLLLFAGAIHPVLFCFGLVPMTALLCLNRAFYLFLIRRRGFGFLCAAVFWHWLSFAYAAAVFVLVWGQRKLSLPGWQAEARPHVRKTAPALISP
jgi:glycosyltransferase involved in cell wall biosynthesis